MGSILRTRAGFPDSNTAPAAPPVTAPAPFRYSPARRGHQRNAPRQRDLTPALPYGRK